jgi:phosphohistidine swiveling domain-containing protein
MFSRNQPRDKQSLVVSLETVRRSDILLVGGKGANLGELIHAGLPVPPGFVVTTVAYTKFVNNNNLNTVLSAVLLKQSDSGALVRKAFEAAPLPSELVQAIEIAYQRLGACPVAVRSSATAEDLPGAAFAGQQDTFLNVIGIESVLSAVSRCFASLWTDRAIAYRERQGFGHLDVKLAVVIQKVVDARVAGVMFTANPVTGARNEIVIEATPGLGETLVSGVVTPDRFTLQRRMLRGWRIIERSSGKGEKVIGPRKNGGTERVMLSAEVMARLRLSDREVIQLARLGDTIQSHFKCPQDIEWALSRDARPAILQARPMTALPEPPPRISRFMKLFISIMGELFSTRPYPLDITTWLPTIFNGALGLLFQLFGITPLPLDRLLVIQDGVLVRVNYNISIRPSFGIFLTPLRLLWNAWRYNPEHWSQDSELIKAKERLKLLEKADPQALSWDNLFSMVDEASLLIIPLAGKQRFRYFPRGIVGTVIMFILLKVLKCDQYFGTLLSGAKTLTTEANIALEKLAAKIRSDPTLTKLFTTTEVSELRNTLQQHHSGQKFLSELQNFMDEYGHRETSAIMISLPPWKDAPEVVYGILQVLASSPPRPMEEKVAWEVARDEILRHRLLQIRPLRYLFLWSLSQSRTLLQIRENSHFNAMLPMPVVRRLFLEMGRRLVSVRILDSSEDVFHLTAAELKRVGKEWPPSPPLVEDLRNIVQFRKSKRETLKNTPLIDPRLLRQRQTGENVLLSGAPGSPGIAQGPVCIVHNGSEFGKLRKGDVLVAPFTNPAWTPLFQRAVAVVVDTGGIGSHAAIVAREYGIPAVMGTVDGTRILSNGELIQVDGTRGLVLKITNTPGKNTISL